MRVFVAVDLPAEAKKEIEKLYKVLQKKHWKVKWEEPNKLHLTLAFLGNIKDKSQQFRPKDDWPLGKIKLACQKATKGIFSFEVSFKGLGCFPDYDYPRVIWLGLKGDLQSLAALQKNIIKELEKSDIYNDFPERIKRGLKRPFASHITLGRVKKEVRLKERREIGRQLRGLRICDFQPKVDRPLDERSKILVDRVVIYESKLSSTGSVYQKLEEGILPKGKLPANNF